MGEEVAGRALHGYVGMCERGCEGAVGPCVAAQGAELGEIDTCHVEQAPNRQSGTLTWLRKPGVRKPGVGRSARVTWSRAPTSGPPVLTQSPQGSALAGACPELLSTCNRAARLNAQPNPRVCEGGSGMRMHRAATRLHTALDRGTPLHMLPCAAAVHSCRLQPLAAAGRVGTPGATGHSRGTRV